MKTKSILLLLLTTTIFLGCKNSKTVSNTEEESSKILSEGFKVTLNVIVKKDDDFSLFYTEDGTIDFKGDPIWIGVKGSENVQEVVYNLPVDIFPTQLRLDFGMNKNQEDIILKSVVLEYKDKTKEISGTELGNFFRADESKCSFDVKSGIIKAVVKDGIRLYPSLYPCEIPLGNEIAKLVK